MKKKGRPKRRVRFKTGDVVAIPLTSNQTAYARILRDCGVQIFDLIDDSQTARNFIGLATKFFAYVMPKKIESGKWPIVGHLPFRCPDDEWTPPMFIQDILNPKAFRIYERGEMRNVRREDIAGLDENRLFFPEGLIEEIIKRFEL